MNAYDCHNNPLTVRSHSCIAKPYPNAKAEGYRNPAFVMQNSIKCMLTGSIIWVHTLAFSSSTLVLLPPPGVVAIRQPVPQSTHAKSEKSEPDSPSGHQGEMLLRPSLMLLLLFFVTMLVVLL